MSDENKLSTDKSSSKLSIDSIDGCKRVLLKVSGEALMGTSKKYGHDLDTLQTITRDIKQVVDMGVQVCIVVGGGNIYRGRDSDQLGIEQATADYMGMLATVMNALALQNALEKQKIYTRIQSAIPMTSICEPFIRRRALRHMQKGRVVIFAAGIGNPFFTTDSAAVLRAIEMNCDLLFKGTNVDGVYDANPVTSESAKRLDRTTYDEVLRDRLNVMDMAAIAVARENKLPIKVFSIKKEGNFAEVLKGNGLYTLITS